MPSDSFVNPSSASEQIIPSEATPRSLAGLILSPSSDTFGKNVPSVATGTKRPALTLAAPQTIVEGAAAPISTWQTLRRSAFGWGWRSITLPTTTPFAQVRRSSMSSTSNPAIVSISANASGGMVMSTSSLNQFKEIRITCLSISRMQEPFYPLPASDGERHDMRGVGRDVQKLDDADSRPGTQ